MKVVFLSAALFLFNGVLLSQWANNEDPLAIKELKLTRLQQKKIKKINKDATAEIRLLQECNLSNEEITAKVDKVNGTRIKKIRNNLSAEQQMIWRKKLMEAKPRKGVTGEPYEKTLP